MDEKKFFKIDSDKLFKVIRGFPCVWRDGGWQIFPNPKRFYLEAEEIGEDEAKEMMGEGKE